MALNLEDKKAIVAEVAAVAAKSVSAAAAEYRGLTVTELTQLRVNARQAGVYLRVVRNTLARRAIQDTDFACLSDALVGPLLLGFSQTDLNAVARLFRDFSKKNDRLSVKALAVGSQFYDAKHLEAVATLPTRDEAISQLMAVMKAPVAQFVRTLAAPASKFVRTVAAVRDQKQAQA